VAKSLVIISFFCALVCPAASVSFPLPTINATLGTSQAVATGNFITNGYTEIITADAYPGANSTTLTLWENNGDGDFFPSTTIDTISQPANTTVYLSTADFNHDGNLDLLVFSISAGQAQWAVYLGNGDGTFQAAQYGPSLGAVSLPVPSAPPAYILGTAQPYGIGNLKGNNIPDIIYGDQIFIGNGNGTFQSPTTFSGGGANILLADFDGDGKLDVVGVSQGQLSFSKGNGDGTFQAATTNTITGGYWAAVGDFNGDGKPDVLTSTGLGLSVLPGVGNGSFDAAITTPISSTVGANTCGNICVVDLNGDGKDDVIVAGAAVTNVVNTVTEITTPLYFLLSNGKGGFSSGGSLDPKGVAVSSTYSPSILTADFNGDFRPDLLLGGSAFSEPMFATSLGSESNPAQVSVLQVSVQPPASGTVTAGYLGSTVHPLGASDSISAKAAKGFAFTNWTDGQGDVITNGATLKFVMASNLTFVANFTDITAPTLTITAPKTGSKFYTDQATVTGTATDNVAVSNVVISVNGAPAAATLSNTTWSASVTLVPGSNSISAYAVDDSENHSKTNTVSLTYIVTTPLTLTITGGNGTVSGASNGQELVENASYTLDAKADSGFAFEYWSGDVTMTANPKLTFTMVPGLAIIANFKDVTAPTLVITAPKANEKYSNATITVTGTAADNVAVGGVYVQINDGGWNLATGTTSWSNSLPVVGGANLVQAYAVDNAGNISKTNSVSFTGVLPPDWAPASLVGKVAEVTPNGGNTITVGFDTATFSQTDTNSAGDSGTGTYDYTQTATNVADLSMTFVLPPLLARGEGAIQLDYTNANEGTFTNFTSGDYGDFAVAFTASNLPTSWSGHTFTATNYSGKVTTVKMTSSTGVIVTDSDGTATTNTYVVQEASPIAAMITVTNTTTSKVDYFQPTFTTKSDGVYEVNNYLIGVYDGGDSGTFGFK